MIVAWTSDPAACRRTALRLEQLGELAGPPAEILAASAPTRWWWLTPPADLLEVLAGLEEGDQLLVAHHPACEAPVVVAAAELAAASCGAAAVFFPKLPRWILEPVRCAVRVAKPEGWEGLALDLQRAGRSIRQIERELRRRYAAGELREAPSRATIARRLRG